MAITPLNNTGNITSLDAHKAATDKRKHVSAEPQQEELTLGVKPREVATADTVELNNASKTTDDATATTAEEPKKSFPLVPVAGSAALGAGVGAGIGILPDDWTGGLFKGENAGKAKVENGAYKAKSDNFTVSGKNSVQEKDTGIFHKLTGADDKPTVSKISHELLVGNDNYVYVKEGNNNPTLTTTLDKTNDLIKQLTPADPADASKTLPAVHYHTVITGDTAVLKPIDAAHTQYPSYEFKLKGDKFELAVVANEAETFLKSEFLTKVTTAVQGLKLENAHAELKKVAPKALTEMLEMEGGGKKGLAVVGAAIVTGLIGGLSGFFLGKPKDAPATPDAPAPTA